MTAAKDARIARFVVAINDNQEWKFRGLCRDDEPDVWFANDTREAKSVCLRCPVTSECLAWALATGQDYGVWGGMDEGERKKLKKRKG